MLCLSRALLCAMMLVSTSAGDEAAVDLVKEAGKKFGEPLSGADRTLFEAVAGGNRAIYSPTGLKDGLPRHGDGWKPEWTVKADRIEWLCTSPKLASAITHEGVRIVGAKVEGALNLTDAKVPFPLAIESSFFGEEINISGAEIWSLSLDGSSVEKLSARSLRTTVDVQLGKGFRARLTTDLSNARIGGDLDLTGGEFCYQHDEKRTGEISIYADYMTVGRDLSMMFAFRRGEDGVLELDRFKAGGQVRLAGSRISGDVNCSGGWFQNQADPAIDANGMVVEGNAYFTSVDISRFSPDQKSACESKKLSSRIECRVDGELEISNADLKGDLHCAGGQFHGESSTSGNAIRGHGLKVEGDAHLDEGFAAIGRVDLSAARVDGSLQLMRGSYKLGATSNRQPNSSDGPVVLDLRVAVVRHDVVMGPGFQSEGAVRLDGATIGGDLDCCGGRFKNPGQYAIAASGATIKGNVHLKDDDHIEFLRPPGERDFVADGMVILNNAQIGCDLDFSGGSFGDIIDAGASVVEGHVLLEKQFRSASQVNFPYAKIGRRFVVQNCVLTDGMTIDLEGATVGTIAHDPDTAMAKLLMNGLTYDQIDREILKGVKAYKKWLELQVKTSGSCYVQLASVLTRSGLTDEANEILIAKEVREWDALSKVDHSIGQWLWYAVLGPIIQYGYDPLRAFWHGLAFVALGWFMFWRAHALGFLAEKEPGKKARKFSSLIYSIDLFTPIVNFYERENWSFVAQAGGGIFSMSMFFRVYWMAHIILGWVITSLLVAGLLGLLHH